MVIFNLIIKKASSKALKTFFLKKVYEKVHKLLTVYKLQTLFVQHQYVFSIIFQFNFFSFPSH